MSQLTDPAKRAKIERLIRNSPSPTLARTNLLRLIENGGPNSLKKFPDQYLRSLIQLLGGSAYLSDILIRKGPTWPALFQDQIQVPQKTASDHLAELKPVLGEAKSLDDLAGILRQHKQREYLRIGARDLSPSVSVEETMRELTALAEASLESAYRSSAELLT